MTLNYRIWYHKYDEKRKKTVIFMKTGKLTMMSMLLALALIIFIIESALPPLAPIPGIKMGLANVITLVSLLWLGKKEAFTILILRIVLGTIFTGSIMSIAYSLAGGILCFGVMSLVIGKIRPIWVVSVCGAISHNIGQIAAAIAITGVWQIALYLPVLMLSAVVTGVFTGVIANEVIKRKDILFK